VKQTTGSSIWIGRALEEAVGCTFAGRMSIQWVLSPSTELTESCGDDGGLWEGEREDEGELKESGARRSSTAETVS